MPGERRLPDGETSAFRQGQRRIAISMAGALCVTLIALAVAVWSAKGTGALPFADRLQATIRLDGLVVIWLAATIANVARLRFFSAQDIGGSGSAGSGSAGASDRVRMAGAIAQNTLEQAVLAIAAHLVVTAAFVHSQPIVQTLVGLFTIGRVLFWAGYARGASGRAFGFALSFYPSVLALLASLGTLLLA